MLLDFRVQCDQKEEEENGVISNFKSSCIQLHLQGISVETSHVLNAFCLECCKNTVRETKQRDQVECYILKYVLSGY